MKPTLVFDVVFSESLVKEQSILPDKHVSALLGVSGQKQQNANLLWIVVLAQTVSTHLSRQSSDPRIRCHEQLAGVDERQ